VGVRERVREDAGSPFAAVRVASRRYRIRTDQTALRTPASSSGAGQEGPQITRGRRVTWPKKAVAGGVARPWRGREKGQREGP